MISSLTSQGGQDRLAAGVPSPSWSRLRLVASASSVALDWGTPWTTENAESYDATKHSPPLGPTDVSPLTLSQLRPPHEPGYPHGCKRLHLTFGPSQAARPSGRATTQMLSTTTRTSKLRVIPLQVRHPLTARLQALASDFWPIPGESTVGTVEKSDPKRVVAYAGRTPAVTGRPDGSSLPPIPTLPGCKRLHLTLSPSWAARSSGRPKSRILSRVGWAPFSNRQGVPAMGWDKAGSRF